ncbi:helix-turn-helix domain-containing protein [Nocardia niigatensis]
MDGTDLALAEVVKDAIAEAGLTQKEVRNHAGIAETTWERRIACPGTFKYSELMRVAEAVGCRTSELIARTEQRALKAA